MNRWLVLIPVVALIAIGSYFGYTQLASQAPLVVTLNGVTAQVQSCTKTASNQYVITVLLTADPTKVHLYEINAQTKAIGWGGNVALSGYGQTTAPEDFQNLNGTWTATAPITIPLIDLPNYDCQLGGWTPILHTY